MTSRRSRARSQQSGRTKPDWETPVSPNTIEGRIDFVRRVAMAVNARRRGEYESLPLRRLWIATLKWLLVLLAATVVILVIVEILR